MWRAFLFTFYLIIGLLLFGFGANKFYVIATITRGYNTVEANILDVKQNVPCGGKLYKTDCIRLTFEYLDNNNTKYTIKDVISLNKYNSEMFQKVYVVYAKSNPSLGILEEYKASKLYEVILLFFISLLCLAVSFHYLRDSGTNNTSK